MAKQEEKLVRCRYKYCNKLHETVELKKDDAVIGGNSFYYHQDCYHIMNTVKEIRDLFIQNINRFMTRQQIGALVNTIHNIVFGKNVDIDYLKFALQYFIKNKPGSLKQPYGLHLIIQNSDVAAAWEKRQERIIRNELQKKFDEYQEEKKGDNSDWNLPDITTTYKPSTKSRFSSILGA